MQMPQPHINVRVREIFRKIYDGRKINLTASKNYLEQQLALYLDHLGNHVGKPIAQKDEKRVWALIERNNQVAKILSTPGYRKVVKRKRQLSGGISLGLVFCIDGRIPAIFLGGRYARHFEIPAGEITTNRRKSDNKLIPDSSDLNEALRKIATLDDDLLEIVFAHTSLTDPHHGCGAMMAKMRAGLVDPKLSLEEANLKIIKDRTIPAISNMFNEFRSQVGLEYQKVVGIAALYDTDTFGIILNFDLKKERKELSTTELTNKYKQSLNFSLRSKYKDELSFGSFKEKFTDLKYATNFAQRVLQVTEDILDGKVAEGLTKTVDEYLGNFYKDLSEGQTKALKFVLVRNIAFQYLTGLSVVKRNIADHAFAKHEEGYMAVAMRGATLGKFDPQNQGFASTPSDPKQAISNINTMLSILGDSPKIKPYILFVCNSVNIRDLRENNQVLQRIIGSNAGLLRDIIEDKKLGEMIGSGELIPVPVLIEEDTREVLKIVDHSGYI